MRYLITGGAGFIGSHLTERLLDRGETLLQEFFRHFSYRSFKSGHGSRLCNARAHQATTEHANFFNFH